MAIEASGPDAASSLDAGPSDAGASEAGAAQGPEGNDAQPPASLTDAGQIGITPTIEGVADGGSDGGPEGASGAPDAGTSQARIEPASDGELGLAALELVRDRLRLRFLASPAAERSAVLAAVRRRRRLALEAEASRAEVERATQTARRADAARRTALERRAESESEIERELFAERARIERARSDLASWEANEARERESTAQDEASEIQVVNELERELAADALAPEEADRHYDEVVRRLRTERERLDTALNALGSPSTVPMFRPSVDPQESLYRSAPEAAELIESRRLLERQRRRAVERERRARWDRVHQLSSDLRQLDRLRVALLPEMSRVRRETVLGLGPEGREQLQRELTQASLMFRAWGRRAWHELPKTPQYLGRLLARSSTRTELLSLLLVLGAMVFVWRRRERLTDWLRKTIQTRADARLWRHGLLPLWIVIGPLVVPLAIVLGLHLSFALAHTFLDGLAFQTARILLLGAAWFSFAVRAFTSLFVSRLRHGSTRATQARRILSSVRLCFGFAFVAWVLLSLAELLVGQGYLYGLVVDLAGLGTLGVALLLVHRWANDVTDWHRARHPGGLCAKGLAGAKNTRLRRYLLTLPASLQLGIEGTVAVARGLALRFEQSRRAFAFLFRRKLEKQVDTKVLAKPRLPEVVWESFTAEALPRDVWVDHFPGLALTVERARTHMNGGPGFVTALVGERGIGKTTWLRALREDANLEAEIVSVPHGLVNATDVCRWVAELLDLPKCSTVDALQEAIDGQQQERVLLLDHCQNLVVRAIGGTQALDTLVEIAARTSGSIAWVCSFSRFTWRYLEHARQAQDLFSQRVDLTRWPEEKIVELIRLRMRATEQTVSYSDLVKSPLEGNALQDAIVRTEEEYLRLLWDYADGNPRIAIHFWLRSLLPREDELRVRLFLAPNDDALGALHEQSRFLLAAVVLHENLTLDEAARTVSHSPAQMAALFAYLERHGFVEEVGGQWSVATHWYRAVIRHLRRRRLLFD